MDVYELESVMDDPRFGAFDFEEVPSLLGNDYLYQDFAGRNRAKLSWEPVSLAGIWTPQRGNGAVRPYVDYTQVSNIPVFSQRAVTVLREFLEPNGELLPLLTKKGTYFVYNILTKSTALNVERSKARFVPESAKETAFSVEYFWFDESKLMDHLIFRIREYPAAVFVTDTFRVRVEQAGLNGFYFTKVWPFAEGESWERAESLRRREKRKQQEPLRGHCLTIRLTVAGREPTDEEGEAAVRLAEAVDELIEGRDNKDEAFIGAVEAVERWSRAAAKRRLFWLIPMRIGWRLTSSRGSCLLIGRVRLSWKSSSEAVSIRGRKRSARRLPHIVGDSFRASFLLAAAPFRVFYIPLILPLALCRMGAWRQGAAIKTSTD